MKSRKGGLSDKDAWKKRKRPTMIPTEGKAAAREKEKRKKMKQSWKEIKSKR